MFSFRTTSIEDQLDRSLLKGDVGVFCTQNSWYPDKQCYLEDIFRSRGNLRKVFRPIETELTPGTNHIGFSQEELEGLSAVVVEIQDVGTRYFNYTRDVMRLLSFRARMEEGPSIYIIDHINPAGRVVEGTIPALDSDNWTPKVAHRHGLTLGELCNLYYSEIGARFPLHVISARAISSNNELLPWAIAPASDIPGLFTCELYSGGGLWNNTTITPAIGTSRPYEYFGAPFIKPEPGSFLPKPPGVLMRPCDFTPSAGRYKGEKCYGYQILLLPGAKYHSLLHTLLLMRYFTERYSQFEILPALHGQVSDPVISEYLRGGITFDVVQEHVKVEEQKWIRKAKRFLLYEDSPYRNK
ncbi:MAG: DUF1343 domain-containing protein [Bacteroidales bacterium]|nr:DUF1343 domain-containing protein [Bacteroidales bacterium]